MYTLLHSIKNCTMLLPALVFGLMLSFLTQAAPTSNFTEHAVSDITDDRAPLPPKGYKNLECFDKIMSPYPVLRKACAEPLRQLETEGRRISWAAGLYVWGTKTRVPNEPQCWIKLAATKGRAGSFTIDNIESTASTLMSLCSYSGFGGIIALNTGWDFTDDWIVQVRGIYNMPPLGPPTIETNNSNGTAIEELSTT